MAKRAPNTEPYRPVQASLVSQVLAGAPAQALAPAPAPEAVAVVAEPVRAVPHPVPVAQPAPPATRWSRPSPQVEEEVLSFDKVERLTREKRVMLSASEEERVEDLVRSLARELRTPLKLSHLLRASLAMILRSREELLGQARHKQVVRPPNGDAHGLAEFERSLSALLDNAMRMTRPPV